MTKKFTRVQLLSLTEGRLSTKMDDVYDMLNHIFNTNFFTHQLPSGMEALRELNPKWFQKEKDEIEKIARKEFYTPLLDSTTFRVRDIPFKDFISVMSKPEYNIEIEVPQL
jgi:hypothetical protein